MSMLLALLGLLTFSWGTFLPQSKTQQTPGLYERQNLTITGTTFDEKQFVSETDMKVWTVTNPTALKGHAGHHVRITTQADTSKNILVVKSIKLVPAVHKMPSNDDCARCFPQRFLKP